MFVPKLPLMLCDKNFIKIFNSTHFCRIFKFLVVTLWPYKFLRFQKNNDCTIAQNEKSPPPQSIFVNRGPAICSCSHFTSDTWARFARNHSAICCNLQMMPYCRFYCLVIKIFKMISILLTLRFIHRTGQFD